MPRRPGRPKPPPTPELDSAVAALLPLLHADKAARKWPANAGVSDLIEALGRYERELQARPDHPRHAQWLADRDRRNAPGSAHRG